jgi:hypothetical protein
MTTSLENVSTMRKHGFTESAEAERSSLRCLRKSYLYPTRVEYLLTTRLLEQRKRKSRCVIEEELTICVLCKFHGQECTFVQNPQSRKRKPTQDPDDSETAKRRYEHLQNTITCFMHGTDKHISGIQARRRGRRYPQGLR